MCDSRYPGKEWHHVIPKYRGGTDDPDNLVSVNKVQHAMWHWCNYQLWQDERDYNAWNGLKVGMEKRDKKRIKKGKEPLLNIPTEKRQSQDEKALLSLFIGGELYQELPEAA